MHNSAYTCPPPAPQRSTTAVIVSLADYLRAGTPGSGRPSREGVARVPDLVRSDRLAGISRNKFRLRSNLCARFRLPSGSIATHIRGHDAPKIPRNFARTPSGLCSPDCVERRACSKSPVQSPHESPDVSPYCAQRPRSKAATNP
jgi:hypothetical protein